jgi:class 3 adenylate cyclase/tetratricopeptide (TPR) repeat protein
MPVCAQCGTENPAGSKFCRECATPLAGLSQEHRKVVTVLFCDVTGSTELGERLDPEVLRELLARYFGRMKAIVERYGGTVEKFIGDAVMAVFGVPVAHEDDALRACRAAVEMRHAFPELGVEGRIGITTGDVVTGTEERLVTGDAVNVAARLEQAAQPGEILIGSETHRLAGDALAVEPLDALAVKGKSEAVTAFRLLSAHEAERRHEGGFVGRERELALICAAWERVHLEQRCELVTITGEPGVGKSRLVAEAVARIGGRSVHGRCLAYGAGITYWPVVEMLKQLAALPSDDAAAAAIRSLLGETPAVASADEIAWAFRKLLEEQAPLVAVLDDIQWAEETLLDLLEHVAFLSSGAPLLLLCTARPEFAERRPGWPVDVRLEPLPDADVDELIGERVAAGARSRIVHAAGGNPLFVAEMLSMATETGGDLVVPPTLRALLVARLDQLDAAERLVVERAAIEGEVFHRGGVQALVPAEVAVTPRLTALVRKELIRPDRPQLAGEDGFRFRHLLVRDTAYEGLPKTVRADLHERFADWLEVRARGLVELDEIVGYHLEQAATCKQELGRPDRALAERAAERLASAGRRALWRFDNRAARSLLGRALALTRDFRLDVVLELDLAFAAPTPREAAATALAAAALADAAGDPGGALLARSTAAAYATLAERDADVGVLERLVEETEPLLAATEDDARLAHFWRAAGVVPYNRCRFEELARTAELAVRHARLAGRYPRDLFGWDLALVWGPRPADDALGAVEQALRDGSESLSLEFSRAELLAMTGRFDDAWQVARDAYEHLAELTGDPESRVFSLGLIATLAGDHALAARYFRAYCGWCEKHEQPGLLSSWAPALGRQLCVLGDYEEAEPLAARGRELGGAQDALTQIVWRQVQALVDAHRGDLDRAEALAREAVAISEQTDALNWQGDALSDLAEVLDAGGRSDDAEAALEQALERYERKRNVAMADQLRARRRSRSR